MFWSDAYLGLPFRRGGRDRRGIDCFGLLRLVWREQAGVRLPRFDCWDRREEVMTEQTRSYARVEPGLERSLDAVWINEDVMVNGQWESRPVHMGVVACPGMLLHIEEGRLSAVDDLAAVDVHMILRGPDFLT